MIGEIGALYQKDKQVGGIFNWSIDGVIAKGRIGRWAAPHVSKKVTASSYWLITEPTSDIFKVDFYQQIGEQLILIDTGNVKLGLPDTTTLDRTLRAPLTLRWIWDE